MITLPNFPMRNQRKDVPSADGSSPNAAYDCVPTCLAACVQYFDGKVVAADDILDMVYGEKYRGGTNELNYAGVMESHYGLSLGFDAEKSGTKAITDRIRYYLSRGIPCIVTMQSDWNAVWGHARFPGLHVGVAYSISETDSGNLTLMNPWFGGPHTRPVLEWAARLGIGVWPVSKIVAQAPVVALPAGWHDDGTTLTTANGVPVVRGFRQYVLAKIAANAWRGGDALVAEYGDGHGGSVQEFAATLLLWNAARGVYEGTMADALAIAAHEHQGKAA